VGGSSEEGEEAAEAAPGPIRNSNSDPGREQHFQEDDEDEVESRPFDEEEFDQNHHQMHGDNYDDDDELEQQIMQ